MNVHGRTSRRPEREAETDPSCRGGAEDELSDLLVSVLRELRRRYARLTDTGELSLPVRGLHLVVLREVAARPGVTINELARLTGVPKSQISVVIARLAAQHIVEKYSDNRDRRLVRLRLTEEGSQRAAEWRTAHRRVVRELLGPLSQQELADVAAALDRLHRAASEGERTVQPQPEVRSRSC